MTVTRLHPVPVLAGLIVIVGTTLLGNWQMQRAAEKQDIQARIDAGLRAEPVPVDTLGVPAEWQNVSLTGNWRAEGTIYLDNRVYDGRAGYHVLTPLQLANAQGWVLVNRGWVFAGPDRATLPPVPTALGPTTVIGQVREPESAPFTLATEAGQGALWQYIDVARYRDWSGLAVRDWIVQQTSSSDDGLVRDWPRPDAGMDRHRGYALQWYSFAGIALALTGFYVYRSVRSDAA
ncbi:SURF1 family protein [Rhodocyclaceae bacterium SMB388]